MPERLADECEQERLGHALDRERVRGVTHAGNLAVHPRDRDAEQVRTRLRERRDVVGHDPVVDTRVAAVRSFDDLENLFGSGSRPVETCTGVSSAVLSWTVNGAGSPRLADAPSADGVSLMPAPFACATQALACAQSPNPLRRRILRSLWTG